MFCEINGKKNIIKSEAFSKNFPPEGWKEFHGLWRMAAHRVIVLQKLLGLIYLPHTPVFFCIFFPPNVHSFKILFILEIVKKTDIILLNLSILNLSTIYQIFIIMNYITYLVFSELSRYSRAHETKIFTSYLCEQ